MALLLVLIFIVLVFSLKEKTRLFFLIFAFPLEVISYHYGLTIKLWMVIFSICLTIWVIHILIGEKKIRLDNLFVLILLLTLANTFSLYNAVNLTRWSRMTTQCSILLILTLYIRNTLSTPKKIKHAINSALFTGVILSIYGLFQWMGAIYGYDFNLPIEKMQIYSEDITPHLVTWWVDIGSTIVPRIRGTFGDPTIYGGYIVSICPLVFSLALFHTTNKTNKKTLYLILSVITFAAALGTFSRSIIIGLFLSVMIVLFYWKKALLKIRVIKIFFIALPTYILLILVLPPRISNIFNPGLLIARLIHTFEPGDLSTIVHKKLAYFAIEIWERYPLLGGGLGNYGSQAGISETAMSHSAFLSFFAETGLIGGLVNLLVIGYIVLIIVMKIDKLEQYSYWFAIATGLLAGYIGTVSGNVFYHYYNQPHIWFIMGIIVALVSAINVREHVV